MLAIHEPFTHQMCDRLKTTAMGLGLVRLLQDARRFEESRATLFSLEEGFQNVGEDSNKPIQKANNETRLNSGVSTSFVPKVLSGNHEIGLSVS